MAHEQGYCFFLHIHATCLASHDILISFADERQHRLTLAYVIALFLPHTHTNLYQRLSNELAPFKIYTTDYIFIDQSIQSLAAGTRPWGQTHTQQQSHCRNFNEQERVCMCVRACVCVYINTMQLYISLGQGAQFNFQ